MLVHELSQYTVIKGRE